MALIHWAARGAERLDKAALSRMFVLMDLPPEDGYRPEIPEEDWQNICRLLRADPAEGMSAAQLQVLSTISMSEIARWAAAHPHPEEYDALFLRHLVRRDVIARWAEESEESEDEEEEEEEEAPRPRRNSTAPMEAREPGA